MSGTPGTEYSLVVTKNADFDTEPNDDLAPDAQDVGVTGRVLGAIAAGVTPTTVVEPITEEIEPNDDGVEGGLPSDLTSANDWSGGYALARPNRPRVGPWRTLPIRRWDFRSIVGVCRKDVPTASSPATAVGRLSPKCSVWISRK